MTSIEGEVMSEAGELFIEKLMTHILHLRKVPKVQVERVIGPILGLFIADLLSKYWSRQGDRPVKVEKICEEFPLRKPAVNDILRYQSTNIDWLLYVPSDDKVVTDGELVFLELKTACTSFDPLQTATYRGVIEEIEARGAFFLERDLVDIKDASLEPAKYEEVLKCFRSNSNYSNCRKAKLVYLGGWPNLHVRTDLGGGWPNLHVRTDLGARSFPQERAGLPPALTPGFQLPNYQLTQLPIPAHNLPGDPL